MPVYAKPFSGAQKAMVWRSDRVHHHSVRATHAALCLSVPLKVPIGRGTAHVHSPNKKQEWTPILTVCNKNNNTLLTLRLLESK